MWCICTNLCLLPWNGACMHCFSSIFTQCSSSLEMRYWCARMSDQTILSIVFSCNASLALKLRLWLGTAASGLVVTWIVWYSRWYPTMQEDLHQLEITAAVGLHFWGICCYAWLRSCIHKILFGVLKQKLQFLQVGFAWPTICTRGGQTVIYEES